MEQDQPSGRPGQDEYSAALVDDVATLPGNDAVAALRLTGRQIGEAFSPLADERIAGLRYHPEKWTVKDVLQHLVDDERSYAWRALAIARGDERAQPGFDENLYAVSAEAERRSLRALLSEHAAVRAATVAMFSSLSAGAWTRRGMSNGESVTVRGLGFQIAAHEAHHLRVLRDRYFPLL